MTGVNSNIRWGTCDLLDIIIENDGNIDVHIYIDGAHAVYSDSKGHPGLFITLGTESIINVSNKLGVVTNSFTETEVVSNIERSPMCTWSDTSGWHRELMIKKMCPFKITRAVYYCKRTTRIPSSRIASIFM